MELSSWIFGMLLGTAILAAFDPSESGDLYQVDPRQLGEAWEKEHISPPDPNTLRHADLQRRMNAFVGNYGAIVRLEKLGDSTERRDISMLSLGTGPKKILLWSQMHGDEPTATCSLIDLADFLCRHREESWVKAILAKFSLLCIPMLNPDGAERNQRRNAQGIDINRDARALQTPEGRILKYVRDRARPFLGFKLHNQNSLTTVGDTGRVATIALLAVAADDIEAAAPGEAGTGAPREFQALTKQVTAVLFEALSPFVYGHISRYDENYNPRAFGDNLTLLGTPIVLIESGGNPAGQPANFGVKLNFIGLLSVLDSLASGKIANANPAVFDALKMNSETPIYDLLLRNGWIFTGTGVPIFKGDVAIRRDKRSGSESAAIIADLGDLGVFTAHETIDCSDYLVTPGLIGWDPRSSLFSEDAREAEYLSRGFVTVLKTASWKELESHNPSGDWRIRNHRFNWSYVVSGEPAGRNADELLLADWLAAGGRAVALETEPGKPPKVPSARVSGWFGIETLSPKEADSFRIPTVMEGEPARVLQHWTSEAARRFHLPQRGVVSVGNVPDLVLWKIMDGGVPADLRTCRPERIVLDGRLFDPAVADSIPSGHFLGREIR